MDCEGQMDAAKDRSTAAWAVARVAQTKVNEATARFKAVMLDTDTGVVDAAWTELDSAMFAHDAAADAAQGASRAYCSLVAQTLTP